MALLPKLKLKAIVSFPANVFGGTGIDVSKTNGNFTINLDYSEFPTTGTLPPNTNALVWDPVTDTYYLVPPSSVGGISDAPSDSKMYGRINRAWVDAWASPVLTGNPTAPTPTVGDNDTSIATTAFVASAVSTVTVTGGVTYTPQSPTVSQQTIARQNIYAAPFDAMAYSGMQINGSMEVSQENGTTARTTQGYACDGWVSTYAGSMALSFGRSSGVNVAGINGHVFMTVTTAQTTMGASDYVIMSQNMEGTRISRLAWGYSSAQPLTIGFWTGHHRTGTYTLTIRNAGGTRSYAAAYTQNAADVMQYNVITIPGCTDGIWPTDNTASLLMHFGIACGTTLTAPSLNSWLGGNYIAGIGQVNAVAATSDVFRITGVVVLPGIEAPSAARSPLIMRPYDQELVTCRQYYQQYHNILLQGYNSAGGTVYNSFLISPVMRSGPFLSQTGTTTANNMTGLTPGVTNSDQCRWQATITATGFGYIDTATTILDARL